MSTPIKKSLDLLIEALKDEEYRYGWQSAIAMAIVDQWNQAPPVHLGYSKLHLFANKAAAAFLDQLTGKDVGDLPGMASVAALHAGAKPIDPTA